MAAGGALVSIVGWSVVGLALLLAVALAFLEVGYSEDRERAREEARRRGRSAPP